MAAIDSLLKLASLQGANELRVGTDKAPAIFLNGASLLGVKKSLTMRPMPGDELRYILGEVLTEDREGLLRRDGQVEFAYFVADVGTFHVVLVRRGVIGPEDPLSLDGVFRLTPRPGQGPSVHLPKEAPEESPLPASERGSSTGTAPPQDGWLPPTGPQTAGTPAAGPQAAGTPAAGPQTAGTPAAGPQTAGTPAAGPQAAGTQAGWLPTAGPPVAGPQTAGTQAGWLPTAGPPVAGPQAGWLPPAGPQVAWTPPAGLPAWAPGMVGGIHGGIEVPLGALEKSVMAAPSAAFQRLLQQTAALGASDLHLRSGEAPQVRVNGRLVLLDEGRIDAVEALLEGLLDGPARLRLAAGRSVDLGAWVEGAGRFRINVYRTSEGLAVAVRVLRSQAPALEDLALPLPLDELIELPHGLVIVAGPTGSGKSTTLAALAQEALRRRSVVLIGLEDPIEYLLQPGPASLVRQRQVGREVVDMTTGLRDALREDPDILLIGEMRDPESIALALTAAETGHLVLTSLHSRSSVSAIERIVDTYAPERQQQIRVQLADALRAVVTQRLLPRTRRQGRVPALEVLRGTHAVASLIREGKTAQLPTAIQSGRREGMVQLERTLADLVRSGQVTTEAARAVAGDTATLAEYLR